MKATEIKQWVPFMLIFTMTNIYAQTSNTYVPKENSAYYFTPQNVGFSTPQTSEFLKYGNLNINHYNGLMDLEIPLYEYNDNDFDMPISIKYISDGFKPARRPSLIGNNWVLNIGGVITRNIYGSPDDVTGKSATKINSCDYMPDGYLVGWRKNGITYTKDQLWSFQMSKTNNSPFVNKDFLYDFNSDIFYFNFGKHKGSFIIREDSVVLLSGDEYTVDISNLATQNYSTTAVPKDSKIVITTSDGFKYEFGGNTSYLEYFIPNNPDKILKRPVTIVSWYLKTIIAPNGRTMTFSYTSTEQKNKYDYYISDLTSRSSISMSTDCQNNMPNSLTDNTDKIQISDRMFIPFLDKIETSNVTIELSRNKYNTSFYSTETTNDLYNLSTIKIKYSTQLVKEIAFTYITNGKYFFLDTLKLNNQSIPEVYKFDYNLDKTLPDPQTISIDHWGFWNGGYATTEDIKTYLMNIDSRKAASTSVFGSGLLKKITYPAGGSTEIEYDYNRYKYCKVRDPKTIHLKDSVSSTDIPCGGARVKLIKDYDPVSAKYTNERNFEYKSPSKSTESGIIGVLPKYKTYDEISTQDFAFQGTVNCGTNTTYQFSIWSSNTIGSETNISEYHIEYQDVTERLKDNGYIYYHFSSLADIPDDEVVNIDYYGYNFGTANIKKNLLSGSLLYEKFGLYIVNDMSAYRGKLLEKTTYSVSGEVEKEKFTYNLLEAKNSYEVTVKSTSNGCIANKIFTMPCRIIQHELVNSNVSSQTNYSYNFKNLISTTDYIQSDGKKQTTKFVYPFEIKEGTDTMILRKMTERNILSNYVEKVVCTGDTGVAAGISFLKFVISGEYKKYNEVHSGIFKPQQIYNLELQNPMPYNSIYPLDEIVSSSIVNGKIINVYGNRSTMAGNQYLNPKIYYDYDNYGNLRYSIEDDAISTVYLWSYNYQYPIAEIKNATLAEAEAAAKSVFAVPNIDSLSAKTTPDEAKLKDGSLQRALPNAQVSTYTYKPLVGMTSATAPNGVTTDYSYDAFGRLAVTRNMDNDILARYRYAYKSGTEAPVIEDPEPLDLPFQAFILLDYSGSVKVTASVQITGGSGDYTISWQLKNESGTIVQLYDGPSFSFKAPASGVLTLHCTVTDNIKNIITTVSRKVIIPILLEDPI